MKFVPAERFGFYVQDIDFSVLKIRNALLVLTGILDVPGAEAAQQGLKKEPLVIGKQVACALPVKVSLFKQRNQAAVLDLEQAEALL